MGVEDIDYGPLTALLGTWRGDKGLDIAPLPDGTEEIPYFETICFEAAGDVTNAESQVLSVVRYHQVVSRKSNGEVFHDQVGYWTFDPATGTICQSVNIPRAVAVLAGGQAPADATPSAAKLQVAARKGSADWGVIESPFMRDQASTTAYELSLEVAGDTLRYRQTTYLDIYGRKFDHVDTSELERVAG